MYFFYVDCLECCIVDFGTRTLYSRMHAIVRMTGLPSLALLWGKWCSEGEKLCSLAQWFVPSAPCSVGEMAQSQRGWSAWWLLPCCTSSYHRNAGFPGLFPPSLAPAKDGEVVLDLNAEWWVLHQSHQELLGRPQYSLLSLLSYRMG